jgi:hypothetical protein
MLVVAGKSRVVLFDFDAPADYPELLAVRAGEIVEVIKDQEDGWSEVETLEGKKGEYEHYVYQVFKIRSSENRTPQGDVVNFNF